MKNKFKWLVSLIVLIIVIVGITKIISQKVNEYDSVEPKRGAIVEAVYGMGTVTASNTFNLRVGVNAGIKELFVNEGAVVKKSDALVRFDDGQIVRSPFEGTVTAIHYKVGENVSPQTVVLTIQDLRNLYISVSLEQQGALRVQGSQQVEMSFESLRGQKVNGIVRSIFPQEGQFIVHIDSKDFPKEILPGMTADVAIAVGKKESALLIPTSAINSGKILIRREGKKIKTDVKVGIVDGNWAEVIDGSIQPGDLVLVPHK